MRRITRGETQTHIGRKRVGNQTHKISQIYSKQNRNTGLVTLGNLRELVGIKALVSNLPGQLRRINESCALRGSRELG